MRLTINAIIDKCIGRSKMAASPFDQSRARKTEKKSGPSSTKCFDAYV
jgi:hypothetical protein